MSSSSNSSSHSLARPANSSRLNNDVYSVIVDSLAIDTIIEDTSLANDFVRLFLRTDGWRTLAQAIPLVSKEFNELFHYIKPKHIYIMSSRHLDLFATNILEPQRFSHITRLSVTIDTHNALSALPGVLDAVPQLECFSFRHVRALLPSGTPSQPSRRNALPTPVVDAISRLALLRVLVFLPGMSVVSRENLERISEGVSGLKYLHIPCVLYPHHGDVSTSSLQPLVFPAVRTVSMGISGGSEYCISLNQLFVHAVFPSLKRLNAVGSVCKDLIPVADTLGRVRHLETLSSNGLIWEALAECHRRDSSMPMLQDLCLHVDETTHWISNGWPHLRRVTVVDDMDPERGRGWSASMTTVLDSVLSLVWESPSFRYVHVVLPWGLQGRHHVLKRFLSRFARHGVLLTWKYTRRRNMGAFRYLV